ncbi:hypothetical protein QE152_g18892 [Popillia japonica]|uniref:Uncharacterized protein n=1 Tax=Popillia japonica TaxID=7064 RepID=A0AAW1L418_POPJA
MGLPVALFTTALWAEQQNWNWSILKSGNRPTFQRGCTLSPNILGHIGTKLRGWETKAGNTVLDNIILDRIAPTHSRCSGMSQKNKLALLVEADRITALQWLDEIDEGVNVEIDSECSELENNVEIQDVGPVGPVILISI